MGIESKPNIDPGLGNKKLDGIAKLVADGILPPGDLDKARVFNQQLQPSLPELPKPKIKRMLPENQEFILPDGKSVSLSKRQEGVLELVFNRHKERIPISNEDILSQFPSDFIPLSRSRFSIAIAECNKKLASRGWKIKNVIDPMNKTSTWKPFKIEKPDPKTATPELLEIDEPNLDESSVDLPDGQKIRFHSSNVQEVQLLTILAKAYKENRIATQEELFEILKNSKTDSLRETLKKIMQSIRQRLQENYVEDWTLISIVPPEKSKEERTYLLIPIEELKKAELPYLKGAKFQKVKDFKPPEDLGFEMRKIDPFEAQKLRIDIAYKVMDLLLQNKPEYEAVSAHEFLRSLAKNKLKKIPKDFSTSEVKNFIIECFKERVTEVFTKFQSQKNPKIILIYQEEESFYLKMQKFFGKEGLTSQEVEGMIENLFSEEATSSPETGSSGDKVPSSELSE